jgi:5-methylcytosine-specific restriction protein A
MGIKSSALINNKISPFLYGVIFSRIMTSDTSKNVPSTFYVYSIFKSSKIVKTTEFDLIDYSKELIFKYDNVSGYKNWRIKNLSETNVSIIFDIDNDLRISKEEFFKTIYKKLISEDWLISTGLNDNKKEFVRGYMESRGSIDLSAKLIAQDYFYDNQFELKRIKILTDDINIPVSYANFNPRNLQPQFVSGEHKRNSQFRINIFYYAKNVGFINKYKAYIFQKAFKINRRIEKNDVIYFDCDVPRMTSDVAFIKYLNFFTNNIYDKNLNDFTIKKLRKELGFNGKNEGNDYRSKTIVKVFDEVSEDECAICKTRSTFTKSNGRQGFEIHHMIPFHNGKEFDNIANFVKLCSNCHDSLKKGRSLKSEQLNSIRKILFENSSVFEYTSATMGIDQVDDLAEAIWLILG